MEVLFDFLVHSFSLSVGLEVVGCGESGTDSEETLEFSSELGSELGTSIRDDSLGEAMVLPNVILVENSKSSAVKGVSGRDCVNLFRKTVNDSEDSIDSLRGS